MNRIEITNPFGKKIHFEKISKQQRQKLLAEEVDTFFRDDECFVPLPIYLLKNGNYLMGYTINDYALIFHNLNDLNSFSHNQDYFPVSLNFINGKLFYKFQMKSSGKIINLMNTNPEYVEGYPSKTDYAPYVLQMKQMGVTVNKDYRLYKLKTKGYLRVNERVKDVYDAEWFPDLEAFEYFYENRYTD